MNKLFKGLFLSAFAVSLLGSAPGFAATPQWIDATHSFEKDVAALNKSVSLETKSQNAKRFRAPAPVVKDYKVGDVESFWTKNIATNQFEQIQATTKAVGKNCYVFLENGKTVADSAIQKVVKQFDDLIYPTDTTIFGQEWKPGVDGNNRITLLMFDIKDGFNGTGGYVGGYFFAGDEFLQSQIPANIPVKSNEREMFYLDINPADPTSDRYMSIVAHEFQHMIHFIHDPKEFTWLNEACSQIACYFCKYGHPGQIQSFMQTPDNSMTAWAKETVLACYGEAYLWNYYIINRFLKTPAAEGEFFKALVDDKSAQGTDAFDKLLKKFSTNSQALFVDFSVTNFLNDPKLDKGQYAYDNTLARFRLPPTAQIKAFPGQVKDKVFLYSADGIKADITGAKANINVAFKGDAVKVSGKSNSFTVAAILSDSRNQIAPKISLLKPASSGAGFAGALALAKGSYDTLQVVVINLPPLGVSNKDYAPSPTANYSIDFTDSGTMVAATRTPRGHTSGRRLVEDYLVSAGAVTSRDEKVSSVALNNLEGLTFDLGKVALSQAEAGSFEAIDNMINTAVQDEDSRESLKPLAKKLAVQLEAWKVMQREAPEALNEKIKSLRSF